MQAHADEIKKILEEHDFDETTKSVFTRYFDFSAKRYYQLRKALVIFVVIASLGCAYGIQQSFSASSDAHNAVTKLAAESADRRNQSCLLTERTYKKNVDGIVLTYDYIDSLTSTQVKDPLNQLIIKQLPKTYADAKLSQAPPFCDEPNVGQPEPNPKLPPLRDFSKLLVKR